MNVHITFRHLQPVESLKQYAREKVEKVNRSLDKIGDATVVLTLERHLHHADIRVHSGSFLLRGRDKSEDMFASIDLAMEKIDRQLKRYKDKMKGHHASRDSVRHPPNGGEETRSVRHQVLEAAHEDSAGSRRVVKTNEFLAQPMALEEAIMHMDLMNNTFLVFTNSTTMEMNVVYHRHDSTIGLIEASAVVKKSLVNGVNHH